MVCPYFCNDMQSPTVYFRETQRFNQPWLWILLALPLVAAIAIPMATEGSLRLDDFIGVGLTAAVILLLRLMKLETRLDSTGITVRFFPFHLKPRFFSLDNIASMEVTTYKPLQDYGGWGLRVGSKGAAFNTSGKNGMLVGFHEAQWLVLGKQKNLMIGTQQPEALSKALEELKHAAVSP